MSQNVTDWIAVTIPSNANTNQHSTDIMKTAISDAIDVVVEAAGGCTCTPANGLWHDDGNVYDEEVERYQFNFPRTKFVAVQEAVKQLVAVLFEHGEKAVFRERHYVESGYNASILFAPTRH